jgi:hypothetical protein
MILPANLGNYGFIRSLTFTRFSSFFKRQHITLSNPVARKAENTDTLKDKHTDEELFIFTKPIQQTILLKTHYLL